MTKPRIGITTSYKDNRQSVDVHYAHAVESAGGIPIIVPMFQQEDTAREFATLLDGLIITGGPGITRGLIGDLPDDLAPVDVVRDTSDELMYHAMADRPILGICYGMQFVNAMAGGTIYGDVQNQRDGSGIHSTGRGATEHNIAITSDSYLRDILNVDQMMTNTYHLQAISKVGQGLTVSAQCTVDGVIEAIESDDRRIIGVQFHPERMTDRALPLFTDLIERAKAT